MEMTGVQKWARALRSMVNVTIIGGMLTFPYVPAGVYSSIDQIIDIMKYEFDDGAALLLGPIVFWWKMFSPDQVVQLLSLWACLICVIVILWQARKILGTIIEGEPFQMVNAVCMHRAAITCWVVSGIALVRLLAEVWILGNEGPIHTYNALFIPMFFMAGLLFSIMSALFHQATQMKEEQDLTI